MALKAVMEEVVLKVKGLMLLKLNQVMEVVMLNPLLTVISLLIQVTNLATISRILLAMGNRISQAMVTNMIKAIMTSILEDQAEIMGPKARGTDTSHINR